MTEYSDHDIAMMESWSQLREAKGLSLEEIAAQTNIPVKKLAAIENHEFDNLGNETFVLGYLRTYAKYLEANADVLIQVYRDAVHPQEALLAQTQGLKSINPIKQILQKVNALQLSIGVIVLWIVVMLLFSGGEESDSYAPQEDANVIPELDAENTGLDQPETTAIQSDESAPIDSSAFQAQTTSDVSGLVANVAVDNEVASSESYRDSSAQEDVSDSTPVNEPETSEILPEDTPSEALDRAAEPNPEIGSGDDLIVLTFTGECWLEVKDATGQVLIAELQRKGDNQRVFGQAPFEVMLGNARVTTLTLNGEVVSTTPPAGRKTLRFTIPR
ncbi:MAG: DUF4115 domain-containing protein [Agarilytica sp.]